MLGIRAAGKSRAVYLISGVTQRGIEHVFIGLRLNSSRIAKRVGKPLERARDKI